MEKKLGFMVVIGLLVVLHSFQIQAGVMKREDPSPSVQVNLSVVESFDLKERPMLKVEVVSRPDIDPIRNGRLKIEVSKNLQVLSENPLSLPEIPPGSRHEFRFFLKPLEMGKGEIKALFSAENSGEFQGRKEITVQKLKHRDLDPPIKVELSADKEITSNQQIQLTIDILSRIDVNEASLEMEIPDGVTITGGNPNWGGFILKDTPLTIGVSISTLNITKGEIKARITVPNAGEFWGTIRLGAPQPTPLSATPPQVGPVVVLQGNERDYQQQVSEPSTEKKIPLPAWRTEPFCDECPKGVPNAPGEPGTLGTLTVNLYLSFQNDLGHWVPARDTYVEMWDWDFWSGDDLLASGLTDGNGFIQFSVDNNDPESGTQDPYIKIYCAHGAIEVTSGGSSTYVSQGDVEDADNVPDGTYTYYWGVNPGQNGAWNIFDALAKGWLYLTWFASEPSLVWVTWPGGCGQSSCQSGDRLYITGPGYTDPDEWDETVTLHEYGHFIMDTKAEIPPWSTYCNTPGETPPCGHSWSSHETNEIAWMEGWANFMQSAVRCYWASSSDNWGDCTRYIETTWSVSLETDSHWPGLDMDDVEGATAAILWDIFDNASDAGDTLSSGLNPIWDVFVNYDPSGAGDHNHVWTIHEFWDGWFARGWGNTPQMWQIFNEHGVVKPDSVAPNNPTSVTSSHTAGEWSNDPTISFSWSGASDATSGVNGYSYATDQSPSTIPDTSVDTTGTSHTTSTLGNSNLGYYFHIRTRDNAGNWNSGAVHRGPYYIDAQAPTMGSISINSGATYTKTTNVNLALSSTDSISGLCSMAIFNDDDMFSIIEDYATSRAWVLNSTNGTRTVKVRYWDCAGNSSGVTMAQDTIILDGVAPSNPGSCTETHGVPNNTWQSTVSNPAFSWSGASDATSGVKGYYWYFGTSSAANPTTWTTSAACDPGPVSAGIYYLRVKTEDNAGNQSAAATLFTFAYYTDGNMGGSGSLDILWRNQTTGQNYVWFMNGTTFAGATALMSQAPPWQIVATGDFNANGTTDIVWRNQTTGQNAVWFMNGTTFVSSVPIMSQAPPWQIVAAADFDGDGDTDILWRNQTTGQNAVWRMNGTTFAGAVVLMSQVPPWEIVGTGDFNGNGTTDILWRNQATGQNAVWFMNGTTFVGATALMSQAPPWQIVATGDFNDNGTTDILWRNQTTGHNYVWLMNGTTFVSSVPIMSQAPPWEIVGPK